MSGDGIFGSLQMCRGIVENKDVFLVGVVLLKDFHCLRKLSKNFLVGEVPVPIFARPKDDPCRLQSVLRAKLAVVSRDKISHHH
jgi:hypothetical protein